MLQFIRNLRRREVPLELETEIPSKASGLTSYIDLPEASMRIPQIIREAATIRMEAQRYINWLEHGLKGGPPEQPNGRSRSETKT